MHLVCHTIRQQQTSSTIAPLDAALEAYVNAALRQGIKEVLPLPIEGGFEVYAVLSSREELQKWESLTEQMIGPPQLLTEQLASIASFFGRFVGFEEPVPGEPTAQFLIEEYLGMAAHWQSVGPVLARVFREAESVADMVHQHTALATGATTPAEAIPEIAGKIVAHMTSALILGENEQTLAVAEALAQTGFQRITFSHPESSIANDLALRQMLHLSTSSTVGVPIYWDERHVPLEDVDVVVITDDEPARCLNQDEAQLHLRKRKSRALVVVDASKRSTTSTVSTTKSIMASSENVFIYALQDLQGIAEQNIVRRKRAIPQARKLVEQHAQRSFQRLYDADRYLFDGMVACSRTMHTVLELARRAAFSEANILIQGETGTGKELLARAIHMQSPRARQSFVVVNCGAIPEELLESELFGHVRGAFTGAIADKRGLLEECHQGTLLLDEIGDMSLPLQVKLLRAIQEGEIRSVGSTESRQVDVRILASTHRDLQQLIQEGKFREDLYYRLNVIQLTLPPLRDRKEDIPPLTETFMRRFAPSRKVLGRTVRRSLQLTPEAEECLLEYEWPGNVRELENMIERSVALSFGSTITLDTLPRNSQAQDPGTQVLEEAVKEQYSLSALEARYIEGTLKANDWNLSRVCEILGISRTTLWRKMSEYGLNKDEE